MERRWSKRTNVGMDINVGRLGTPPVVCRTRNVCTNGAFVELDVDRIELSRGATLKLEFMLDGAVGTTNHTRHGVVVHRQLDGVGVTFPALSGEVLGAIEATLRRTAHAAVSDENTVVLSK